MIVASAAAATCYFAALLLQDALGNLEHWLVAAQQVYQDLDFALQGAHSPKSQDSSID